MLQRHQRWTRSSTLPNQRIDQAVRDGAFDHLPGRGLPLQLEDLDLVPPELRSSWILLRTHGLLPPELEARKECLRLEDLLAACAEEPRRAELAAAARRALLRYRLLLEHNHGAAVIDYRDALHERLGHR